MSSRQQFATIFREIHPKFSRLYAKMLHDIGLSLPQYTLLNQLSFLGSVSMTEISGRMQITKPAVTNLVDRLEEKKFLRRTPHPKDRRVILLEILPKGQKAIATLQANSLDIILKAYDQYSGEEHSIISRFYATVSAVIDEHLEGTKK